MTNRFNEANNSYLDLWKILYFLWFLKLFRPERVISYYIPQLTQLHKFSTLLLLVLICLWLLSSYKKVQFKIIGIFLILLFFSSIFAYNTGRARTTIRIIFEIYLMGILTFSIAGDQDKIDKLFRLVFFYYFYFAVWILVGKGVVWWDYFLNEEDAAGPLMCIGLGFCSQYYLSQNNNAIKKLVLLGSILCLTGVVASFARGAFLVLITTIGHIWLRSKQKIKGVLIVGLGVLTIITVASILYEDNSFWDEMSTIADGTSKGSSLDRQILWKVAWFEFLDHPFLGVGPGNFGIAAPNYISKVNNREKYLDPGQIWGRALHNGFFQILCELGSLGSIAFIFILFDFYRSNFKMKSTINIFKKNNEFYFSNYVYILTGLEIGLTAFLLNAIFYDIIYYPWFWNIIILNRLLCLHLQKFYSKETSNKKNAIKKE